jgi:acyl carrier protein
MNAEAQIRKYIVDNFMLGSDDGVTSSQSLLQTGVVDSTGVMELVLFLEKTFHLKVEDGDLVPENLDTISSIACFVERKMTGGGGEG